MFQIVMGCPYEIEQQAAPFCVDGGQKLDCTKKSLIVLFRNLIDYRNVLVEKYNT